MGLCDGRVAIVTGAGRGIGREHALSLAGQGAKVVVNDLGGNVRRHRRRRSARPQQVVDEIEGMGGEAVANGDDVSDWEGAAAPGQHGRRARSAASTSLVNNAGILRDRMLDQHDRGGVGRRHQGAPQGHVRARPAGPPPTGASRSKAGKTVDGRIINTTSLSGIYGNAGQTNYGAAKAGIAAFTDHRRAGARPLRRHRQRHRPGRAHPHDRGPRHGPETDEEQGAAARPAGSPRSSPGWPRPESQGRDRPGLRGVRPGAGGRRGLAPRPRARPGRRPDEARADRGRAAGRAPGPTPAWTARTAAGRSPRRRSSSASTERSGGPTMPINPDAVGATSPSPVEHVLDVEGRAALRRRRRRRHERAGVHHREHRTASSSRCCPTFAVVRRLGPGQRAVGHIGTFNPAMLVHGEQARRRCTSPIPAEGTVDGHVEDRRHLRQGQGRGRGHRDRAPCWPAASRCSRRGRRRSSAARAAGAATAARRGPRNVPPERGPDHAVTYQTRPTRRCSTGSRATATRCTPTRRSPRMGGFDRPILHGLCTYGFTGRALLHALCGSDPARFQRMEGRFSSPVMPGDALTVVDVGHRRRRGRLHDGDAGRHRRHRPGAVPLRQLSA